MIVRHDAGCSAEDAGSGGFRAPFSASCNAAAVHERGGAPRGRLPKALAEAAGHHGRRLHWHAAGFVNQAGMF